MKELNELNFPDDVMYTDDHEWAKMDNDEAVIGISDYAQDQLGDIVFVELPQVGEIFEKGAEFGTVESVKAVSELFMPVSGEIVAVNDSTGRHAGTGQQRTLHRGMDAPDQAQRQIRIGPADEQKRLSRIIKGVIA